MSTVAAQLGTRSFYLPLVNDLQTSNNQAAQSAERLSSGNRIIQASDDVAALTIGTQLQAQASLLTQASSNVAQGTSLLEMASTGLTQISTLLNNMQTLAEQSSGSAITDNQRAFLQQQFASYISQLNTVVSDTSFNGINLLDGTLAGGAPIITQTSQSTPAAGAITFTSNPTSGTVILNGQTLTEGSFFTAGVTTAASVTALANALNSSTNAALSQATYSTNGNTLIITAKAGGALGNQYTIDQHDSTTSFTTTGGSTNSTDIYTLANGTDNGVGIGSTTASGAIGDTTVVTAQSQTPASVTLAITGAVTTSDSLQFDNGKGGTINFTFVNGTPASSTQIKIGSSTAQTLQNIVSTVTAYSNSNASHDNYGLRQLSFNINGSQLAITSRTPGNPTELDGSTALTIGTGITNSTLSLTSFNNGSTSGGVNTSGVAKDNFTGTISGFTATYIGSNSITASVNVGGTTYNANITNTNSSGTVRFSSGNGGYFDVHVNAIAVGNQSAANTYAGHLNTAFSGLTFYQQRPVASFSPTGTLAGATATLQLSNFAGVSSNTTTQISNIAVTAPSIPGGNGTIAFTINGATFQSETNIGSSIGAYQSFTLTNTGNASQTLTITNGATAQDFSTATSAATLQTALKSAFDFGASTTGTNFQVGPGQGSGNTINVSIGNVAAYALFGGNMPDISTTGDAAAAQTAITTASNSIQTIISNVSGLQTSFNAAAANLTQSIGGTNAASSALLDTNIATESTNYIEKTLAVNAGAAVLAQAFGLSPNLLLLLRPMPLVA